MADSHHGNPTSTVAPLLAEITHIHLLAPQLPAVLETGRLVTAGQASNPDAMLFRHPGVRRTPCFSACIPAPILVPAPVCRPLPLSSMVFAARKCSTCASVAALLPLILLQVTHRVLLELPFQ